MCNYIHTLVSPSDICTERLRTYKNLCEKENVFSSTYQVLYLLKWKDRAGKTQFHIDTHQVIAHVSCEKRPEFL